MGEQAEVLVVGAGAAGLAAAAALKRRGIPAQVLERTGGVASSWRSRYDSLILNTPRITSTLAGYRMPRRYGRWPSRDDVIEYLEEYARRHDLQIRFGVEMRRLVRRNGDWALETSAGELRSEQVVIATGHECEPLIPEWPGRDDFPGEIVHSADYRNPQPFRGRRVLVVSASNSGSEIADELARDGAAQVWTSMRTPPPVVPREWLGMPLNYTACLLDLLPDRIADLMTEAAQRAIYGDLSKHGIPRAPVGAQTRARKLHQGVLVDAGFVKALKEGRVELVSALREFDGAEAVLVDETRLRPDAVIAATGFGTGLVPVLGHLGVLAADGYPSVVGARTHPNAPGLYFNGYLGTISGGLRHMRRHARAIARAVARQRAS
ncbi:MAG: flavin-containing monooxygenase [Solirubrobacterales bacterium]